MQFSHLHVHTQFSLLDGAADISKLYKKAIADDMPAIAITDHGNMFGVFDFVAEAQKHRLNPDNKNDKRLKVKPIVGCEFYLVEDRHKKQFTKEKRDERYHQLFLAKNEEGYRNLTKLCSLGFIEGMYSKWPRIDKELVLQYHKGLIATTCCIGAMVPKTILRKSEAEAEKEFKWWLDLFGEDYYIELQRHDIPEQNKVNEVLLKFAQKYNVKMICSNDSHYVDQTDANAHDILLCVNTGDVQRTPIAGDEDGGKGFRFGFPNDQFYFKKTSEMETLFSDVPQSLDNTNEIVDKIEVLDLKKDILLPNFPVPPEFTTQDDYLEHLTFEGAKQRYKEMSPDVEDRLKFELFTIKTMGFAGYFLIVADFIKAGRDLGVFVGPGRGSAAGSAVAYCIGITNIDPVKYGLLFERFLNPDRKSMPDIDTDFDDEGRQKVIDYVVQKYGRNQVAQIITYGTMAAKTSIQDVARVMEMPLNEAAALKKLVPERLGIELTRVLNAPIEGEKSLKEKEGLIPDELANVKKLRDYVKSDSIEGKVLREAEKLEGSVRNTGVHAAGIIIAPKDLTDLIPVATAKDSDLLLTQFEGKVIEDAGVIKMDFLGLKTLTIIKDALQLIKQNHGVEIDIDDIPLDDQKTYELYQLAETNGTFQFESDGMQQYLRDLKPDKFEDLIAMNALYRPGPMEYIPNFIARKHGKEKVAYDLPEMEEYLHETYGITVYQEQVMLLSQKLANFTKGDADTLRKAMGKKQKEVLDKMRSKFMEGCENNGHHTKICEKIWTDWEAFAQYAFNKSHSTCYAFVAYQTAYLKAHYPAEYMASVLNNQFNIEKISFFMEECRRMGIPALGPDLNESHIRFTVNKKGEIRFGLGGVKGLGEKAAEAIIEERDANGPFSSIFNFAKRINLRTVNKKSFESLVYSGALDCFEGVDRARYFALPNGDRITAIEKIIKFGGDYQLSKAQSQNSLFGGSSVDVALAEPTLPAAEPWSLMEKLKFEKDVIGMYLSGHPLDDYKLELTSFNVYKLEDVYNQVGKTITIAGIINEASHRISKAGKGFGTFTIEDFTSSTQLALFSEAYLKFKHFLEPGLAVFIKGKVQPRYNNPGEMELRIEQIQLLSEMRELMTKYVMLTLNAHALDETSVEALYNLVKSTPGKFPLRIIVVDPQENISIEMPSKSIKVDLTSDFFKSLEKIGGLSYRLVG